MRQLTLDLMTGGRARERYIEAVQALPPVERLERWVVVVAHDEECPSTRGTVGLDALDVCNCEILRMVATTKHERSLDEALQDPEFLLGMFADEIIVGFYDGHVNPHGEEEQ